ncbi:hypothetical protein ACFQDM_01440 [Ponticaulis profundi]|uniref:Uncharacterized protein n=1 Tax=Ponticaulis profundi TaxID=2665222 RepID=A0ABW1S571_9PROT
MSGKSACIEGSVSMFGNLDRRIGLILGMTVAIALTAGAMISFTASAGGL